jgi:uncharacterized protein
MSLTLKDCVDPWKAADKALVITDSIPINALQRLGSALSSTEGEIQVDIRFDRDEEKLAFLSGTIRGNLRLECQRCLQDMKLPVDSLVSIAFVKATIRKNDGDDDHISERYDLFEVEEDRVCLTDVIEDELLLLLPQVPMHTAPACEIETEFGNTLNEPEAEEKENPFAILATLKTQKTD